MYLRQATGSKVYGNGSFAPHRGRNKKKGYRQRSRNIAAFKRRKLIQKAAAKRMGK